MRWMAWSSDDDETALWNFGDFCRFVRMKRKLNKSNSSEFSGYRFLKANTVGMDPLATAQGLVIILGLIGYSTGSLDAVLQ